MVLDKCFSYNPISKEWIEEEITLGTKRAYAGSVSLPDGTFWILGGAGTNSVLKSVEILTYKR